MLRALFAGHRESFAFESVLDHILALGFDFRLEVRLDPVDLGEDPETVLPVVVHSGHRVSGHRGLLLFGILAAAFDLNDQTKRIALAPSVAEGHDEIRDAFARLRPVSLWHPQTEVAVYRRLIGCTNRENGRA